MLLGSFYIGTLGGNAIFLGGSILIFFVLLYTNAPNTSVLSYLSWIIHSSAQNVHVLCCSVMSDSLLPRDCNPPGSSVHGDSPGKTTGVDCHALPQWIFPIQGSNLGLPHCRQILYHLNHQEVPECPCFFKFPSKSVVLSIHHWSFIICIIPAVIKGPLDGFLDECVRTRKQ